MSGTIDIAATDPAAPPPEYSFDYPDDANGSDHFMRVLAEVEQDRDAGNDPGVLVPDHGGDDDGPDAAGATAGPGLNIHRAGCVAAGAAAGAVIGGAGGAVAEGMAGAAVGLLFAGPAGSFIGADAGGLDGAKTGAVAGAVIGGIVGGEMCGQQPLVPHHVASTSNEGGAPARGKLTGSTDGLSKDEKAFAEEHLAAGDGVHVIPTGANRTPDFSVNGRPPFELKTVSGIQNATSDGISKAIFNRIMNARGQSGNVIIDARNQPNMTKTIADRAILRGTTADEVRSADRRGKLNAITILTPEGQVTWRR